MVLNVRLRNHENSENGEKLSLDLIFIDNFCQNIKSFCEQNSMLRIHSKPDRNSPELTQCPTGNNSDKAWPVIY